MRPICYSGLRHRISIQSPQSSRVCRVRWWWGCWGVVVGWRRRWVFAWRGQRGGGGGAWWWWGWWGFDGSIGPMVVGWWWGCWGVVVGWWSSWW